MVVPLHCFGWHSESMQCLIGMGGIKDHALYFSAAEIDAPDWGGGVLLHGTFLTDVVAIGNP